MAESHVTSMAERVRSSTGGDFTPLTPDDLAGASAARIDGASVAAASEPAAAALGVFSCSNMCAAASGAAFAACGSFSLTGALAGAACGFASNNLCNAVCNSQGPTSHCEDHAGGRACMNRERFWWCDNKVDGRKVRARYVMEDLSEPGVATTAWAPSQGCTAVRWPTAGLVQRWQVCVEGAGCGPWFEPNHHNATLSSYIPPGTPPTTAPPETPDVTPPSIDVSGIDQTTWRAGAVPIIATASDAESGVASMTVYINEEPIFTTAGGLVAFNWDSSGYNGSMMLKVAASDAVGNTTFRWFNLNVSNRPPTVDLHTPPTVSSQVYFLCNVSGAGPTTRTVLIDGAAIDAEHGWQSGTAADGEHTLTCRATDVMGRVSEASGTIYVYNHPGGLRWIYPTFGTYTGTAAEPRLEVEASVDETDLDFAEIYVDGSLETLCASPHDPNVHSAMDLHCDGYSGPAQHGWNISGLSDGVAMLWLYASAHNDYQMTTGSWSYGHTIKIDNTPPVIVLDATQTRFVDVDGVRYVHLEATTPTPADFYADHPDSIEGVEFFARMPDGSPLSLGAVTSDTTYPWTLTERVPDNAYLDGKLTLYAVATDTVFSHRDTPVHRMGTSATVVLTVPLAPVE